MDKSRLLELENKFILLKRHEVTFEQIEALLPSVDKSILLSWENTYQKAVAQLTTKGLADKLTITSKEESNGYIYEGVATLQVSSVARVIFIMKNHTFKDPKKEKEKEKHIDFFKKHCSNIAIDFNAKNKEMSATIHPQPKNDLIKKKASAAIGFYIEYFGQNEVFLVDRILIEQQSNLVFKSFENILPFGVKQLKVESFQGIRQISIENLNLDAQWIFLTGENSFGKTTILQALALSLTGEKGAEFEKENFAIEIHTLNKNIILNYWNRAHFKRFPHLACYGASRLMLQTERSQNIEGSKSTTTYSLFNNDGLLLNIEYDLFKWFYKKDARFETVINIFKKLIPNIQDIVLDEKDDTIYYIEKDGINRLTFNQLGSGYRSLIGMVGDMMIRLFKTQPKITKPSDLAGIVLIDELDLHWHPKWQRRLPTLLSEIFPKVQFIASTHSEMPLLGAPENSIFLKVTRTLEEGVKVHKIDIDLSNLLPHHLLTSALFDMDFNDITSVTNRSKNKNNLRTEDSMQEIEERDAIKAHLRNYAANNAKFSDDLFD